MAQSWQDLTERNIKTIQDIFRGSALSANGRATLIAAAVHLVVASPQRFESASAQWSAVHNTLRIMVAGGFFQADNYQEASRRERPPLEGASL